MTEVVASKSEELSEICFVIASPANDLWFFMISFNHSISSSNEKCEAANASVQNGKDMLPQQNLNILMPK